VDNAVLAPTKDLFLGGRTINCLHTLKVERRESNWYIHLVGQVMSKDSMMLGSVYSCVKELLRKTLSKYKAKINKRGMHRSIGEKGEYKERGHTCGKLQDFRLGRFLRGRVNYIQKTSSAQTSTSTMFGFQQRTNMETNRM
jgi:hypothetical protein